MFYRIIQSRKLLLEKLHLTIPCQILSQAAAEFRVFADSWLGNAGDSSS